MVGSMRAICGDVWLRLDSYLVDVEWFTDGSWKELYFIVRSRCGELDLDTEWGARLDNRLPLAFSW